MPQSFARLLAPTLAAGLCLSACAVGPNYTRPAMETSPAFKEAQGWTPAVPQDGLDRGDWWALFNDPQLDALEQRVNVDNQNIKAEIAAYDSARALVAADRAALFPTVDLTGAATRSRSGSGNFSTTNGAGQPVSVSSRAVSDYSLELGASWEPDVWGKLRRTVEGAHDAAQSTEADLANARLSAQSELATDYIQLRITDLQKAIYAQTVAGYQRSLSITENQYAQGVAARSDVLQARTQLTAAQANLTDLDRTRTANEHAIATLVGVVPAAFSIAPDASWAPQPPPTPQTVPSILLQRRPDVAAAERTAASANAQIGVQVAGYFPDLTLSGDYGYNANALSRLFNSASNLWSFGGNAVQTIFDAGATTDRVRQAKANYQQEVALYRETVLTAFEQVEDDLAAARVLQTEQGQVEQEVAEADQTVKITLNEYEAGTVAYTSVVTAQATALSAHVSLATLQGQRISNSIGLIAALGGGWSGKL